MVALVNTNLRNSQHLRRRHRRGALVELGARVGATVASWVRRSREAAELARLDDRELRDIGLTPAEVQLVLSKPFWRR